MDETEFRKTYREMRDYPCPFEKAILNRHCGCPLNRRLNLGEREGATCTHWEAHNTCTRLLTEIRKNARFAVKAPAVSGPLPHAKELRVQVGGIGGLRDELFPQQRGSMVEDIHSIARRAISTYGDFKQLPWPAILAAISAFKGRQSRSKR